MPPYDPAEMRNGHPETTRLVEVLGLFQEFLTK